MTTALALRRLYFIRFAFALLWAGATIAVADGLSPLTAALFVLYPLADVAAAVVDARSSRTRLLYANIVVSLLAAGGLAAAGAAGSIPGALRVWGAWAVVAGAIQLVVGVARRRLGGQWPMIISGGLSVLAGGTFIAGAAADHPMLTNAIGYAVPGAIFFLVAAIRLGRTANSGLPAAVNADQPVDAA